MTTFESDTVVQRLEALASAPMGEELAMMDLETGKYLVLDPIGTAVWDNIAEPVRVCDLVAALERRYDVTRERCEADVLAFLRQLETKGLLRVTTA